MVGFRRAEQVGQVEQGVVLGEGLHDGVGCNDDVDCTGLGQLDHLGLGAQQLRGVDLHNVLLAQHFVVVDELSEGGQTDVGGVGGGLVVADADNPFAVACGAAAGEHADTQSQNQQKGYPFGVFHKKRSSLFSFFTFLS